MKNRMMKLKLIFVLVVVMSLITTACGGSGSKTESSNGGKSAAKTTLNVVLVDNINNRGISTLAHEFEEQTGYKVNINVLGQDVAEKRMQLDFIGKTGDLDVAYMSFIMMQSWVKAGWVTLDASAVILGQQQDSRAATVTFNIIYI